MALLCCCKPQSQDDVTPNPRLVHSGPIAPGDTALYSLETYPHPITKHRAAKTREATASGTTSDIIVSAVPVEPGCEGIQGLDELVVDNSEAEDDQVPLTKRASATWGAVRDRLTRHISLESTSKRHSPSLTGRSQEELERRAELKRLMHKRIQDELLCDDSLLDPCTDDKQNTRKPSLSNLSQARGGPRDTIEFIVNGNEHPIKCGSAAEQICPEAQESIHDGSNNIPRHCVDRLDENANIVLSEQHHAKGKDSAPYDDETDRAHCHPIGGSSHFVKHVAQAPLSDPPRRSEREKSDSRDSQSWETQSVLAMWLRSQSVRSRESSVVWLNTLDADESVPMIPRPCSNIKPEGDQCNTNGIHPATRKGSRTASSRNVHPSVVSTRPLEESHRYDTSSDTDGMLSPTGAVQQEQLFPLSPSQDLAQSYAVAMAFDSVQDASSSIYPSALPSIQTSPTASQSNIFYNLNSRDLQSIHLASSPWTEPQEVTPGHAMSWVGSTKTGSQSTFRHSGCAEHAQGPQKSQLTLDTVSIAATESASFRQREEELMTIEKRFGNVVLRKNSPTPVVSRFREEFNHSPRLASRRGTFMAKVHKSLERRSKTLSGSNEDYHAATASNRPTDSFPQGPMASGIAVPSNSHRGSQGHTTRLPVARHRLGATAKPQATKSPGSYRIDVGTEARVVPTSQLVSSHQDIDLSKLDPRETPPKVDSSSYCAPAHDQRIVETPVEDQTLLAIRSQVETPSSWTRFPSATRAERNGSATFARDSVSSHDFAFDAVGSTVSPMGRMGTTRTQNSKLPLSRSVRLGHRVKSGLSKILPFINQDESIRAENVASAKSPSHTVRQTRVPITGDMAASAIDACEISDSVSVVQHSPSLAASGSPTPSITSDPDSVDYKVIESGSVVTMQRVCRRSSLSLTPKPGLASSVALTDVFHTPISQSLADQSFNELATFTTKSITLPIFRRDQRLSTGAVALPESRSCPTFATEDSFSAATERTTLCSLGAHRRYPTAGVGYTS